MAQQMLFFSPTPPLTRPIQGGLMDGMIITVCGRVLPNAERFQVDLQYGPDIVLHVNPRYNRGGHVVHNTYQNGKWGSEECKYETPFPRGQIFALQILVTQESYKISTNGKPFSEYKHRIPFSHVNSICVSGMVEENLVVFQNHAPHHSATSGTFMVPYKSIIYGGLQPGKAIIIQGIINGLANRIEVNLRHKTGIAFYYSARFEENVVVRNTYEDGNWGDEEQSGDMPFERGQTFQVTIYCSDHEYVVFVRGIQTHTYKHRYTQLEDIDVLEISGDVQLNFVQN